MWTNPALRFLHNERIVEWDIKSANVSLMKFYNLVEPSKITSIESLSKQEREKTVGKMFLKDKNFGERLETAFTDIINLFLDANGLDKEEDIVSIKKDAVFVRNRTVKQSTFNDTVVFRPKGQYSGFMKIPQFEFYYSPSKIDVKGINDSVLPLHEDGMLEFIRGVFREASDNSELQMYIKEYSKAYKNRELPFNAYREFKQDSQFKVRIIGNDVYMSSIDENMLAHVDISYNYFTIFLEVLKLIIKD